MNPSLLIGGGLAAYGALTKKHGGSGAAQLLQQALDEISRVRQPTVEDMQVVLQKYVQAGEIRPEEAQTILADPSAFESMTLDPATRAAQADALRQISDIADNGGLTAIDKANIMDVNDQIDTSNRGAQQAITQNAQERGVGGSGAELASRLIAQQGAASIGAKRSAEIAAEAQKRALDAIMQKGNLSTTMRGQDFDQASKVAEARDAINKFNTQNRQAVINANTDRRTDANVYNLNNKQDVSNSNVTAENNNRARTADLKQRVFENGLNVAKTKAGVFGDMATRADNQRAADDNYRYRLIGAGGDIIAGAAQNKKKDQAANYWGY